ncbi:MAG TPA: 50S ribosomal protein L24 [Candidatus Paceibacterota bacterium]
MRIHKNDNVQIMVGKDKGKQGKVLKIDPKNQRVLVQGLNMFKKHKRATKQGEKGEIISISRPVTVENLMVVCNSCKKPARIGYRFEGETKIRYCKKCQAAITY